MYNSSVDRGVSSDIFAIMLNDERVYSLLELRKVLTFALSKNYDTLVDIVLTRSPTGVGQCVNVNDFKPVIHIRGF